MEARGDSTHPPPRALARTCNYIYSHTHKCTLTQRAQSQHTNACICTIRHSYKQEYTYTKIVTNNTLIQIHLHKDTHNKILIHTENYFCTNIPATCIPTHKSTNPHTNTHKATAHTGTSIRSPMHTHLHTQISHSSKHTTHAHICTQYTHTNYTQIHTHIQHMYTHTCTVLHTLTQASSHKYIHT